MCGGMTGALGFRAPQTAAKVMPSAPDVLLYQVGRLAGYGIAGAFCGAAGRVIDALLDLAQIGIAMRIASGTLLVLFAARMLFKWNALGSLERWGARFWTMLQPIARRQMLSHHAARSLILGLLWGWLPCGLVYSMLAFAAASADAASGAAIMVTFGVGTLPAMIGSGLLAGRIRAWSRIGSLRIAGGIALGIFGVWTIISPLQHLQHQNTDTTHTVHSVDHHPHTSP